MLEQLLSFFAMIMGLQMEQDTYYGSGVEITGYLETGYISRQMNMQEIQRQIIIEDYFLFIERLGRINYARGCAGEATPPVYKNGHWYRCGIRSFDCGGMMKYYGYIKGILKKENIAYLNSRTLYELGTPKDPRTAERGDFMYRKGPGSGNDATHFAVITTGYDDVNHILTIIDNFNQGSPGKIGERELKGLSCNAVYCRYMGRYKIYISTNGMVSLASMRGVEVNAFKILDE